MLDEILDEILPRTHDYRCPGGLGACHSSVLQCHGFRPAVGPKKMLYTKLMKKMICVATIRIAHQVMNWLSGSKWRNVS